MENIFIYSFIFLSTKPLVPHISLIICYIICTLDVVLKDLPLVHSHFNQLKRIYNSAKIRYTTNRTYVIVSCLKITFALQPILDIKVILVRLRKYNIIK